MFAHNVGGGALPAPPWLLSYIGAAFVFGTAAALRASWPTARLAGTAATAEPIHPPAPAPARTPDDDDGQRPTAPTWTSAAFLAAFSWYFLAYHRPGSPRSLALSLLRRRAAMRTTWAMAAAAAASITAAALLVLT
ncbi:MAG TPA: hypothetical protein VGP53_06790 [Acidimicrobiales bacterium]|nr:hypothetical protein [Acidimicrobiales bacterium]